MASAIAWYGGENDDRLAWLWDSCSNTSEGGAGWTAVAERGGPLPIKYYYERDTGIKDQIVHKDYSFLHELHNIFNIDLEYNLCVCAK